MDTCRICLDSGGLHLGCHCTHAYEHPQCMRDYLLYQNGHTCDIVCSVCLGRTHFKMVSGNLVTMNGTLVLNQNSTQEQPLLRNATTTVSWTWWIAMVAPSVYDAALQMVVAISVFRSMKTDVMYMFLRELFPLFVFVEMPMLVLYVVCSRRVSELSTFCVEVLSSIVCVLSIMSIVFTVASVLAMTVIDDNNSTVSQSMMLGYFVSSTITITRFFMISRQR